MHRPIWYTHSMLFAACTVGEHVHNNTHFRLALQSHAIPRRRGSTRLVWNAHALTLHVSKRIYNDMLIILQQTRVGGSVHTHRTPPAYGPVIHMTHPRLDKQMYQKS